MSTGMVHAWDVRSYAPSQTPKSTALACLHVRNMQGAPGPASATPAGSGPRRVVEYWVFERTFYTGWVISKPGPEGARWRVVARLKASVSGTGLLGPRGDDWWAGCSSFEAAVSDWLEGQAAWSLLSQLCFPDQNQTL